MHLSSVAGCQELQQLEWRIAAVSGNFERPGGKLELDTSSSADPPTFSQPWLARTTLGGSHAAWPLEEPGVSQSATASMSAPVKTTATPPPLTGAMRPVSPVTLCHVLAEVCQMTSRMVLCSVPGWLGAVWLADTNVNVRLPSRVPPAQ